MSSGSYKQHHVASPVNASMEAGFLLIPVEIAKRKERPKRGYRYLQEVAHVRKRTSHLIPMVSDRLKKYGTARVGINALWAMV